jgi:hypothetical protein
MNVLQNVLSLVLRSMPIPDQLIERVFSMAFNGVLTILRKKKNNSNSIFVIRCSPNTTIFKLISRSERRPLQHDQFLGDLVAMETKKNEGEEVERKGGRKKEIISV